MPCGTMADVAIAMNEEAYRLIDILTEQASAKCSRKQNKSALYML
jgi:hypothetical protein